MQLKRYDLLKVFFLPCFQYDFNDLSSKFVRILSEDSSKILRKFFGNSPNFLRCFFGLISDLFRTSIGLRANK